MNTAREVLDIIDNALCDLSLEERSKLWDVLTALRGPDHGDNHEENLKRLTTTRIRSAAFPKTAEKCYPNAHSYNDCKYLDGLALFSKEFDKIFIQHINIHNDSKMYHFYCHAHRAAYALKMEIR